MKNTEKLLAVLLAMLMVVSCFAACTKEDESKADTKTSSSDKINDDIEKEKESKKSADDSDKVKDKTKKSKKAKSKDDDTDEEKAIEDTIMNYADARYAEINSISDLEDAQNYCVKFGEQYTKLDGMLFKLNKWVDGFEDDGVDTSLADKVYVTMFNLTNPDCKIEIDSIKVDGNKATVETTMTAYDEDKLLEAVQRAMPLYNRKSKTYEEYFALLTENMEDIIGHIDVIKGERTFTIEKTDGKWLIAKDDSINEEASLDSDEKDVLEVLSSYYYYLSEFDFATIVFSVDLESQLSKELTVISEEYIALNLPDEFGYEHSKYCSYEFSDIKIKDDKATAQAIFNRPDISQNTTVDDLKTCGIVTDKSEVTLKKVYDRWKITNIK